MKRKVSGEFATLEDYLPKEKITVSRRERRKNLMIGASAVAAMLVLGTAVTLRYTVFAEMYRVKSGPLSVIAEVTPDAAGEKTGTGGKAGRKTDGAAAHFFSDAPEGTPTPEAAPAPGPSPSPSPSPDYTATFGKAGVAEMPAPSAKVAFDSPQVVIPAVLPYADTSLGPMATPTPNSQPTPEFVPMTTGKKGSQGGGYGYTPTDNKLGAGWSMDNVSSGGASKPAAP